VLAWLPGKHDQELMKMKGQSSTWYFLEQLHVSALRANVTIALTSSITKPSAQGSGPGAASSSSSAAARGGLGGASASASAGGMQLGRPDEGGSEQGPGGMLTEVQRVLVRGMLNRLSGSSGLQLINVSDVGLQLSALDERNRLVNQVGLASLISNHYTWRAYAELRKVRVCVCTYGVSRVACSSQRSITSRSLQHCIQKLLDPWLHAGIVQLLSPVGVKHLHMLQLM
jgi:hypothetical protein